MSDVRTELRERMEHIPVIDAHEHLRPESGHLQTDYNFFHLLVPYVVYDLYSAGMPAELAFHGPSTDEEIERYWKTIAPLWKYVRHGSYLRPTRLALREFWGIDDITDQNYKEIGEMLNATRSPGHYRRVLVDKCNIKYVLNQIHEISFPEPFMKGGLVLDSYLRPGRIASFIENSEQEPSLEDYCLHVRDEITKAKQAGAVQVKFDISHTFCFALDPDEAKREFEQLRKQPDLDSAPALASYISDKVLSYLPELDMVAAVHTGVWHDIRIENPEHLFPVVAKHPDVAFDIYHMGIPYVHECGFLGKNYHNAYLNLCWSHIIAPEMVIRALEEWLDFVPTNKVFGFGGDFLYNPEQTWGHLQIAKDNLSEVFARKIVKGHLDIDAAEEILRLWLYENPARVYGLDQPTA